jgi:lanosterol synthase
LTYQNPSGGCASYEPTRGSEYLEILNAAEVFGRIMIEYDYPECTTAVVTALSLFSKHYPDYRTADIKAFKDRAIKYIRTAQRPDGSWYGSWGICFTYAGMFALESLASIGETYQNSEHVRKGCDFFISKQRSDGGWSESYKVWKPPLVVMAPPSYTTRSHVSRVYTLNTLPDPKSCRQHGHVLG